MVLVNALGQPVSFTDRNGSVHAYGFDVLGRLVSDAVTTLGVGVDGAVRRLEFGYDGQGNLSRVTSYDAASGGNVVNEVLREFNGLGQITREYQEHAGAVNTGTSRSVGYAYSEMTGGANHSRLTSMTYPSGYVLSYDYGTGLDDSVSRLASLSDGTGTLESYAYLGLATVVRRAHPQPDVDLTYVKLSGEPDGDAGDQYTGFDRFGRVVDQRTIDAGTGTALDRFQYGYDRLGNRTYRDNLVNPAFGEVYTYDELNQLTSFQRGTLNPAKDGIAGTPSRTQSWDHDALGNFDSVATDGTPEARTHNRQNEIGTVGPNSLAYDGNGNLTTDEQGRTLVYDAWNRLVEVKDNLGATLARYAYDGLSRRVSETHGGQTRELYYSAGWQVLEEYVNGQAQVRYVWSPVYVDAMVLRQRDTDGNGSLDERVWPVQDANFNVTALVDDAGVVVERYAYDPFGARTVYHGSGDPRAGSVYAFAQGYQGLRHEPATGYVEARYRWLSVTLGRPPQPDPIGFTAGDPNVYRWEGNGPTVSLDPSGLKSNWWFRRLLDGTWVGRRVGDVYDGAVEVPLMFHDVLALGTAGAYGGITGNYYEPNLHSMTANAIAQAHANRGRAGVAALATEYKYNLMTFGGRGMVQAADALIYEGDARPLSHMIGGGLFLRGMAVGSPGPKSPWSAEIRAARQRATSPVAPECNTNRIPLPVVEDRTIPLTIVNPRFRNTLPERYAAELQEALGVGARAMTPDDPAFLGLVNRGEPLKFVVLEDGTLQVAPHTLRRVEISHAVLAGNRPVLAAGEANIAAGGGRFFGLEIPNHSAHYLPSAESLNIARWAFERYGIVFPEEKRHDND